MGPMGPRGLGPYVNIMDVLCIIKEFYKLPGHCHGLSKCGPYGPQGPWAQPLSEPVAELFRFFPDFGCPKKMRYFRKISVRLWIFAIFCKC